MTLDHPPVFGPGVRATIGDRPLTHVAIDDGVSLLRPTNDDADLLVLHQRPPDTAAVLAEAARLQWLDGRGPAPRLLGSGRADPGDETVVVAVGANAAPALHGHPMGPEALLEALAGALRSLHDLPVDRAEFVADDTAMIARIGERIERSELLVAAEGPYAQRSPEELLDLLDELLALRAPLPPVTVHGALQADRVWFDPAGDVTFSHWRRAGVGDRHLDLAAAAALVTELHGAGMVAPLFDMYGLDDVDLLRLNAYQLMAHLLDG